jgi:threonine aldolase
MRQVGYYAAAGLYALDHHVERLKEDHAKAKVLERELLAMAAVSLVMPVETNIVICELAPAVTPEAFLGHLRKRGIMALSIGPQALRFVFHLDVTDPHLAVLVEALRAFAP